MTDDKYHLVIQISVALGLLMIVILMVVTGGCVTSAKNTYKNLVDTPIPTPAPTSVIIIETIPTPTPTPAPTLSEAQYMAKYNGLKQGQILSFRKDNVSGYKDLGVHVSVWGHKEFPVIEWYSVSWGQYFTESPGEGKKFLFVFVNSSSEDGSSRTWGIQPEQFSLDIKGNIYYPSADVLPEIRIHDLDETWDSNHVQTIQPYGYLRTYNTERLPTAERLGFLKCGKSNAWDGYIPFIVPSDTQIKDVKVLGNFHNLIEPHWWQLE